MSRPNLESLKAAIGVLLDMEGENGIDLLTAIAIETTSDLTLTASEEVRASRYESGQGYTREEALSHLLQGKKVSTCSWKGTGTSDSETDESEV